MPAPLHYHYAALRSMLSSLGTAQPVSLASCTTTITAADQPILPGTIKQSHVMSCYTATGWLTPNVDLRLRIRWSTSHAGQASTVYGEGAGGKHRGKPMMQSNDDVRAQKTIPTVQVHTPSSTSHTPHAVLPAQPQAYIDVLWFHCSQAKRPRHNLSTALLHKKAPPPSYGHAVTAITVCCDVVKFGSDADAPAGQPKASLTFLAAPDQPCVARLKDPAYQG